MTNRSLVLLTTIRQARRERAIAAMADARRCLDHAVTAIEHAHLEVRECMHWRDAVLADCTLGRGTAARDALLPACEALLLQRKELFAQAQSALREANDRIVELRQQLDNREREVLRVEAWHRLQENVERSAQAALETREEEEQLSDSIRAGHDA